VVVSAASAYQVGGGFLTGGRHALEEAICMQSTLYFSLQKAKHLAEVRQLKDKLDTPIHIPEKGAVLSPNVCVFRNRTATGYELLDRRNQVELDAVISMAMPNRNNRVCDSPVDNWPREVMQPIIIEKFVAVLQGAASIGATVLVVPDVGCGVFQNDPCDVGVAFRTAMERFPGVFEKIFLTGHIDFLQAAKPSNSAGPASHKLYSNIFSRPTSASSCESRSSSHSSWLSTPSRKSWGYFK